jgi:hypothetical protein
LRAYQVDPGQVRLTVDADQPGFLRLSHPIHPSLHVTENGRVVEPIRDIFSMLVIPVRAGRNHIAVVAVPSTLRLACLGVSAVCAAGLLASLFWLLLGHQIRRLVPARVAAR